LNVRLGVNIDHVATLRNARGEAYPDPGKGAATVVAAGADLVTCHLRFDERHIRAGDLPGIRAASPVLNFECAAHEAMIDVALRLKPDWVCLVPEKREELTTEGGMDVRATEVLVAAIDTLQEAQIKVSLFVDPDETVVSRCKALGVDAIELHTGTYANAGKDEVSRELERLQRASILAEKLGIGVHAGHGLTLDNLGPVAAIEEIAELNIGHALVADALFMDGLSGAVRAYAAAMASARGARV
jgi:pyridoxine 5-phosphate synthase